MSSYPLPIIDLSSDTAVAEIRAACEHIGFFLIANYGVPERLLEDTYKSTRAFFDLSLAEKLKVQRPRVGISRGYDMPGGQSLSYTSGVASPPDLQEVFVFGAAPADDRIIAKVSARFTSHPIAGRMIRPASH